MNLDKRLLRALEPVRAALWAAIGLGVLAGALLVAQAYLLSQAVDRVFLGGDTLHDVTPLLVGLALVATIRALLLWASDLSAHHLASHVKGVLRERLFAHLTALGPAYTRGERSGELAATAVEGVEFLDAYLREYVPQLALSAMIPLAILVVVFPLDILSGVVLLLTAPLIPVFMILIGKLAAVQSRRQWGQLSRMSAHFLDVLQGLTTLKMFGRSREQAATIAAISERFREATMAVLRVAFLSALVLELLSTLSVAVIAVEIGLRLLYARIPFDMALFVLILAPDYYLPLRALGARFHAGTAGVTAAERIFAVLETPVPPCGDAVAVSSINRDAPLTIAFEHVSYAYHDGDRPALNGLSFTIAPGMTVALVGRSGSGKSTAAQVLLRFLTPTAGQITVNGSDLCAIPPALWREQVAWVPQLPYLFAATVADNIRLGRPDAPLSAVMRAAEQARADSFIRALPQGYDTPIGEQGARLSGGQAQRIALARAFLRDAPFLILDEATANLDPDTEAQIADSLHALMHGRTVLVIAHRLHTVMDADQIVVLAHGRAVETGTHDELLVRGGHYAGLIAAQGGAA